jgi:type IV pilus assembly protein PilX
MVKNMMTQLPTQFSREQGLVLVTGLIFLLILTIIGITAMNSTVLSEKMAQNLRDANSAFSASESALTDGERWVQSQTVVPTVVTSCGTPPCQVWAYGTLGNSFYQNSSSWWQSNARPFSITLPGVATQPRYIIELYSIVPYELSPDAYSKGSGYYYYRVTAHGVGATSNSLVNVQSMFATQFN